MMTTYEMQYEYDMLLLDQIRNYAKDKKEMMFSYQYDNINLFVENTHA